MMEEVVGDVKLCFVCFFHGRCCWCCYLKGWWHVGKILPPFCEVLPFCSKSWRWKRWVLHWTGWFWLRHFNRWISRLQYLLTIPLFQYGIPELKCGHYHFIHCWRMHFIHQYWPWLPGFSIISVHKRSGFELVPDFCTIDFAVTFFNVMRKYAFFSIRWFFCKSSLYL